MPQDCQCARIDPLISKSSNTFEHVIFPEDPGRNGVFIEPDETTNEEGGRRAHLFSRSLPSTERKRRQLNISREPRTGRRANERTEGGQEGPRVVIYEVSKTLYTPTRQRAGLAPRNPVLALMHRYLSHDHFRPIHAHGGTLHTYVRPRASSTLHAGVFTIYSAPRVGNAVGYLVDIVYLGYSPPHEPRDFSSRLSSRPPSVPSVKKRQRNDCLAPGPPFRGDKWSSGTYRY